MKKFLTKLLALTISAVSVASCFTACGHDHPFISEWTTTETKHYHLCTCGEIMDEGEHEFKEGVVSVPSTCKSTGVMEYECRICGYKKTETITNLQHRWKEDFDETEHYTICESCGTKKDETKHDLCYEWVNLNEHRIKCRYCDFFVSAEAHDYDENEVCKKCGVEKGHIVI